MRLIDFLIPLILTLMLEGAVALCWGLRKKNLLLFALVNVLTNPLAVLIHALFPDWGATAVLELGVVAAEGWCFWKLGDRIHRPWLFSLVANVFSFCVGLAVNRLL